MLSSQSYVNPLDEEGEAVDQQPESAVVIPAEHSPSDTPLLVAAYDATNSIAVYKITMT